MATATTETSTRYILELDELEAAVIMALTGHVSSDDKYRDATSEVYYALSSAGAYDGEVTKALTKNSADIKFSSGK